jgi:single-stranded-DNA-specific exonuclease
MTRIVTRPCSPVDAEVLMRHGLHPVLARLYAARGVTLPDELEIALTQLVPPVELKGCADAAALLADAIDGKRRILVVADYDCDGATACAVAVRGLRMFGAQIDYLVPNRFEYGYGLTPEIVALAARGAAGKPELLITVDNGIASVDGVAAANALGIDVLVTDHHLPGEHLPAARAIVNPNQPGCTFPSKCIAGVGVMFYVLLARSATRGPNRVWTACSIWSRSAPSRTWSRWTATIACWSHRVCSASAKARCNRASPRCSASPRATRAARPASISALRSGPG